MNDDLALAPATELTRLLSTREISSRELVDGYLDRIDRLNAPINAVVTVVAELAQKRAAAADAATAKGEAWGPLHGLPITLKDAIATAGIRSTGGAPECGDYVSDRNAPVAARLEGAGAIIIGKTNCPRWSLDYATFNDVFGRTNNPHDLTRIPGGSSGGSAAAIAAGFGALEVGTDLGGSIRLPSNFCGVYGFKPSFGAVPQRGYVDRVGEAQHDIDGNHMGPIARSVGDLSLAYGLLADNPARGRPAPVSLDGVRISAWLDDDAAPLDAPVLDVLRRAVDRIGGVDDARPAVTLAEMRALVGPMIQFGLANPGRFVHDERPRIEAAWREWFERYDVMLWPVTPTTAPQHDERPIVERTLVVNGVEVPAAGATVSWTGPMNLLGLPSVVIPAGRAADGLPVGMQVIAAFGHDAFALGVAALIDRALAPQ